MEKEELYLVKIENDVEEKLYPLLMEHLKEVHKRLPRKERNHEYLNRLYELLDRAIVNLQKETNKYNYKFFIRYTILIINTLLTYTPKRDDLKKIKLGIINEFTKGEYDVDERIPLKYQMSEVRITYDVSYLTHLINIFIKKRNFHNALYCFIGVKLIEPDYKDLERYESEIFKNIEQKPLEYKEFKEPKRSIVVLDSNVVLNRILYDVGSYKIPRPSSLDYAKYLDKLEKRNELVITPSVIEEVRNHLKFTLAQVKRTCKTNKRLNEKAIIETLNKRLNETIQRYKKDIDYPDNLDIARIENFYSKYLSLLYEITLDKIEHSRLSQKLRKLAQREGLLPERGDMVLLAEALELKRINRNVCIISNDKDLYLFNDRIQKEFSIRIYK